METDRKIELIPFTEEPLGALEDLVPDGQTLETLRRDLRDSARGQGRQVVMALEDGKPAGLAGWVALGVETEGIVYGSPVLARTEASASALLDRLAKEARALGALQLRVSLLPGEPAKAAALDRAGFRALLDLITVERSIQGLPDAEMPGDLVRMPLEDVDWEAFTQAFNRIFAEVPNAPPVDAATKREEWEAVDREASSIWVDPEGGYRAWISALPDGHIEDVGVDETLRGRGIAGALYRLAGEALRTRGVAKLEAILASTNAATLRLHEKLGFRPRTQRTVFALDLALDGRRD